MTIQYDWRDSLPAANVLAYIEFANATARDIGLPSPWVDVGTHHGRVMLRMRFEREGKVITVEITQYDRPPRFFQIHGDFGFPIGEQIFSFEGKDEAQTLKRIGSLVRVEFGEN